ncbi:MAG TPA: indole-3-glycerol phosphate synthase TrpC [Terrimicrobiaceae bacterium]|nr:indole-3-glycerol phosphate synthase TrpC [Terrimicrobiaceae bacterium]
MKTFLDEILADVRTELDSTKAERPLAEVRRMILDAPTVRPLAAALSEKFSLIAEIKERSPSVGPMRPENVSAAAAAYQESPVVTAISVLTNRMHFGMTIERMASIRKQGSKSVLRKDFIIEEYQVREARAFGADAVLLMANVLDAARLRGFYDLARELGMDALFEVHTEEEISTLPQDAAIVGINSRKFKAKSGFVGKQGASETDFSLDYSAFQLAGKLPAGTLRVAESGLAPNLVARVREEFDAALVGTSLLRDARGVRACLEEFEEAIGALPGGKTIG